ncbi:MAG: hypothetical protein GX638_07535 [Crenarchaeota archaeon]|mgnify:CR=1 FL=1|nr:hypothetical protein [Thermoproteota archaeon]
MSLASSAAMTTSATLCSSQIEYEYSLIQERLQMATDTNTQLGEELFKAQTLLSQCQTQVPTLLSYITMMESSKSAQPQSKNNEDVTSQLNILKQNYTRMKQAYVPLMQRVAYLKLQKQKAHQEEMMLTKQLKSMEIKKKLADQTAEVGAKFVDNAVKRLSFNA